MSGGRGQPGGPEPGGARAAAAGSQAGPGAGRRGEAEPGTRSSGGFLRQPRGRGGSQAAAQPSASPGAP